MQLSTMGVG